MAASSSLTLLVGLGLLLPWVLSQATFANSSTTTIATTTSSSSPLVLPTPVHSDVPPPALPTSCTINSLSSPDFRLSSFLYEAGDQLSVNFTVVNRMAESTISCEGAGQQGDQITGDCCTAGTEAGSVEASQFQYDSTTNMLTVNQSWVCNDDSTTIEPIEFVGTGIVMLAVECSQDASNLTSCTAPLNTRVPLSLSAPLPLTPLMPPPPAGHDNPGCMATSLASPSWIISGFQWATGGFQVQEFILTTYYPALALLMNVTNTATNATVSCLTACGGYTAANLTVPPYLPFEAPSTEDPRWCPCLTQVKGSEYNDNYYTYTNMLLDPVRRVLAIDQTWYCDDEDAKNPVQFTASGEVALPELQCVARDFNDISFNPGYQPPMQPLVNGSTCSAINSFAATGNLSSQNKMEPYALQISRPVQRSCTTASVILQHEIVRNYTYDLNHFEYSAYDTLNDSNSNYEVLAGLDFILMMQGLDVQLGCSGWDPRLNRQTDDYEPDYWWNCDPYRDVDPGSEGGIQHDDLQSGLVNFDAINYILNLNITWACIDISPNQKPVFQWLTSTQLPELNCVQDDDGGNRTHCILPGSGAYDFWVNFSDEIRTLS